MIQRSSFPISLAFVPQGHWTQPHLAIPCLKAWLEARGFDDVEQMDLSVEAFDHFLTPRSLERARDRVRERMDLARFESEQQTTLEFHITPRIMRGSSGF